MKTDSVPSINDDRRLHFEHDDYHGSSRGDDGNDDTFRSSLRNIHLDGGLLSLSAIAASRRVQSRVDLELSTLLLPRSNRLPTGHRHDNVMAIINEALELVSDGPPLTNRLRPLPRGFGGGSPPTNRKKRSRRQ
jgi:hypothetical protein